MNSMDFKGYTAPGNTTSAMIFLSGEIEYPQTKCLTAILRNSNVTHMPDGFFNKCLLNSYFWRLPHS